MCRTPNEARSGFLTDLGTPNVARSGSLTRSGTPNDHRSRLLAHFGTANETRSGLLTQLLTAHDSLFHLTAVVVCSASAVKWMRSRPFDRTESNSLDEGDITAEMRATILMSLDGREIPQCHAPLLGAPLLGPSFELSEPSDAHDTVQLMAGSSRAETSALSSRWSASPNSDDGRLPTHPRPRRLRVAEASSRFWGAGGEMRGSTPDLMIPRSDTRKEAGSDAR